MINILVTGSNGQLGRELQNVASKISNAHFIFYDIDDLDITDLHKIKAFFENNTIDFIINCAAYTAVDKAENDIENACKVNIVALKHLVEAASINNSKIIHISTDYVFDGNYGKPYIESDTTNPQSVYGQTKLAGELELVNSTVEYIIIRTSWLYSSYGNNFVKTMLRLGKEKTSLNIVFDQIGTPTYAKDLADAILVILSKSIENQDNFVKGIYHFSNEGVCSWYDFAIEIMKTADFNCEINPIESKDYPLPAKRPYYSVFNKSKIKSVYGLKIPYWKDSLIECLQKLL